MFGLPEIPTKLVVIFLILSLLIGFFQKYGSDREEQGYNKARKEMLEQFQKDLDDMMKLKEKELDDAIDSREKWKKKAIDLQSRPPKEVKVYVKEIIENNDCTRLDHFSELWNKLRENYN
jgi:hypothetical protein